MTSAVGNLSLCAAVLVATGGMLAAVASGRAGSRGLLRAARWSLGLLSVLLTISLLALLAALLADDYRFSYVASYTERALPAGYKLAALWAGQEGSLLLWAWLLSALCAMAVIGFRSWRGGGQPGAIATMAAVCGFFAALLLFAANPFDMSPGGAPADGRGLNPMLQDPAMILHPPLLFLGYAGFTVPFAVMIGVLAAGRRDNHWIALIRRWLVVSWLFLTAGIALGAWWAYIELGWGGYWGWDPVENASLLPWLTATALIHSIMVQQHRGMFKIWNVSLIAATFLLCIFGTFITRSGVIQSVHAFGESQIGTFFLVFLATCALGSAGLIVARRQMLQSEHRLEGLISREGAFLLGNVLLTIMMLTTLLGTVFPLISGVFAHEPLTVTAPFYNRVVAPLAVLLAGLMALGPVLAFGQSAAMKIARDLAIPAALAVVVTGLVALFRRIIDPWALLCVAIATLGSGAVVVDFLRSVAARKRSTGESLPVAACRLIDKSHRRYGGQVAHLGIMMIVIGVVGSSLFDQEEVLRLQAGETARVGQIGLTLEAVEQVDEVNYSAIQATVRLTEPDGSIHQLTPQKRLYAKWPEELNTEVGVHSTFTRDLYVVLAGWESGGQTIALRVVENPLVQWIWIGSIVMIAGGLFGIVPPLLPASWAAATVPSSRVITAQTADGDERGVLAASEASG